LPSNPYKAFEEIRRRLREIGVEKEGEEGGKEAGSRSQGQAD